MCEQNYGVISVWLNISYDSLASLL